MPELTPSQRLAKIVMERVKTQNSYLGRRLEPRLSDGRTLEVFYKDGGSGPDNPNDECHLKVRMIPVEDDQYGFESDERGLLGRYWSFTTYRGRGRRTDLPAPVETDGHGGLELHPHDEETPHFKEVVDGMNARLIRGYEQAIELVIELLTPR